MIFHVKMTHESLDEQKLFVLMSCQGDQSISKELTDNDANSIILVHKVDFVINDWIFK